MHSFYLDSRNEILTQVTLKELPTPTLNILKSATVIEISLKDPQMTPSAILISALKSLCTQLCKHEKHIVLQTDECRRLKWLTDVVGWHLPSDDNVEPQYCEMPKIRSLYWKKHFLYHTLHVGEGAEWNDAVTKRMDEICNRGQYLSAVRTGGDPPLGVSLREQGLWEQFKY